MRNPLIFGLEERPLSSCVCGGSKIALDYIGLCYQLDQYNVYKKKTIDSVSNLKLRSYDVKTSGNHRLDQSLGSGRRALSYAVMTSRLLIF